jgi:3-methyladenine DNA glycosylase/8-oxoguanine DNA glycosylase
MSDNELIDCLTQVKGIGQWTVEMLLIFNLGRADVFPATDLGVRKGYMLAYGDDDLLPPVQLLKVAEQWKPFRTAAAWYLWRATDSVDWSQ